LLVRIGVPSNVLATMAHQLPRLAGQQDLLDFGAGLIYTVLPGVELEAAQAWLANVRQLAKAQGGYAVVIAAPPSIQNSLDPWGQQPEVLPIMRALKARWDPAGILNPGRFIVD